MDEDDKTESSDGKPTAQDRQANQAETAAPSTTSSLSTEATGIMGAVTGGKSTASDIQHVLSATREQLQAAEESIVWQKMVKSMLA